MNERLAAATEPGDVLRSSAVICPSVVLAIPVRNEEANLPTLFQFLKQEAYPGIQRIYFALAPSSDRSEQLLHAFAAGDSRVEILPNPDETVAIGLNLCLYRAAPADFFIRLDAHARYPDGYIGGLVNAAQQYGALNTGGVQQFRVENTVQYATAVVLTMVSDAGLNRWRNPEFSGFTDTVYLGCYRMDTLRQIGGFSEDQPTNQDAELNQRLNNIKRNAVFQDGSIVSWYAPRKTLQELAHQYTGYGMGRALNWITHWPVIPFRSLLAPLLVLAFPVLLILSAEMLLLVVAAGSIAGAGLGLHYQKRFATDGRPVYWYMLLAEIPAVSVIMLTSFSFGMAKALWQELRLQKEQAGV